MGLNDVKQMLRINVNDYDDLITTIWNDTFNNTQWLNDLESDEGLRHRIRVYIASLNTIRIFGTFPKDMERGIEENLNAMLSKYIVHN